MDSRKRRTARSRTYSREKEDFEELDIPINRRESHRETADRGYGRKAYEGNYGRTEDRQEEVYRHERRSGRGERVKRKRKGPLKAVFLLLLCLCAFFLLWRFISPYFGKKYRTIAIFGLDSRDGTKEAGALSDVIMLASINKRNGEIKLTSVYRDTYSEVNGNGKYHKMNEAYFLGGHEQAIAALERNLDVHIDDYVSFTWAAVAKGISALGGVDLELSDAEFYYINAFITETVESTGIPSIHLEHAGTNHLDGIQAVAYGRLRLMDTDFNRTARQRKVLSLAMDKAKKAGPVKMVSVATQVLPEISTSLNMADFTDLASQLGRLHLGETTGFPFARTTMKLRKMDVVIPATLESNVVSLHAFLYGEENYRPSAKVREISEHIAEVSGVTKPMENAEEAGTGGGSIRKKDKKQEGKSEKKQEENAKSSTEEKKLEESSTEKQSSEEAEEATIEEKKDLEKKNREEEVENTEKDSTLGPAADIGKSPTDSSEENEENP